MRSTADRKSLGSSLRRVSQSTLWRAWLLVLLICVPFASAQEGPPERGKSRDATASIRLPPRTNTPDAETSRSRSSTSANNGLWTTVLSLGAIIGCLGLVGYWLRPFMGVPGGLPIEALELLGRRAIEQKVAIHLIRCGGKVLVVGVSPDGARTLSEITDPTEVQRLITACHAPQTGRSFSALVPGANSLLGSRAGQRLPAEEPRRA